MVFVDAPCWNHWSAGPLYVNGSIIPGSNLIFLLSRSSMNKWPGMSGGGELVPITANGSRQDAPLLFSTSFFVWERVVTISWSMGCAEGWGVLVILELMPFTPSSVVTTTSNGCMA
eukprot:1530504-Ditylum_brightwellii.AAC.1